MSNAARLFLSGMGRKIVCFLCFGAAFAGACAGLAALSGFPRVHDIPDKLQLLRTDYRDCDVVFFGSSRVVHQIEPRLFDATVAAAGREVHSFNFGVESLWPPESLFVLREILKQPTPRLKWLFIELMPIEGTLRDGQDEMERTIYWHDRRHTTLAEQAVLERYPRWGYRLPLLWRHERLWLTSATRHSEGSQWFQELMWPGQKEDHRQRWSVDAGFRVADDEAMDGESERWFRNNLKINGAELARQSTKLPHSLRRAYRPILAELHARGVKPIFFIAPGVSRKTNYEEAPGRETLLSFARPDLYPDLLQPEMFRDRSHLNARGARLFAPLLARKFLELSASQP